MERSQERLAILAKIDELERARLFDRDVEDDPPTIPIEPGTVDYTGKKLSTRIAAEFANQVAKHHFDKCIKKGALIIKEVRGLENYLAVADEGAMITCNHFHPFDNYAVFKSIERSLGRKRLYKLIREGNYTSFPGLYGYFFRHCNTIPIPSKSAAVREMMQAVGTLLKRGEKILVYPEQGMWWNYRKPRPMKDGAFFFAARAMVPVVPFFITMEDTEDLDADGFPIQAYTVHILPAIRPQAGTSMRENIRNMRKANEDAWKAVYEDFYGVPLCYLDPEKTNETETEECSTSQ